MSLRILSSICTFIIAVASCAGETLEGTCSLIYQKKDAKAEHTVEFGKIVKGKCQFVLTDFFGESSVIANGEFENTGSQKMNFHYYVAFFDKSKRMLGAAAYSNSGKYGVIGPGQKTRASSCIIRIPDDLRDQISSYQVTFYESEYIEAVKK
jgi:hypothetical protein